MYYNFTRMCYLFYNDILKLVKKRQQIYLFLTDEILIRLIYYLGCFNFSIKNNTTIRVEK